MRALDRKLLRDAWRLRAQILAIAAVVACGLTGNVAMTSAHSALTRARGAYYDRARMADVWAHATRVPRPLAARLGALPGVAQAEVRLAESVLLDVPGFGEPVSGELVSVPDGGRRPALGDLHLRQGRWVEPGRRGEVMVSDAFARAHGLVPGDRLGAVFGGRREELTVVGMVLSPEHVFSASGANLFPDNRRWGVLWMEERALAAALDLQGAFNDVALALSPEASEPAVIAAVDALLAPYGSPGAYGRERHPSDRFLTAELDQLELQGVLVPAVFLAVAAFLLNVVLGRLITGQREEVAALKALGYADAEIGLHFVKFVLLVVAVGTLLGFLGGAYLGEVFLGLYRDYFRFPSLTFQVDPRVLVQGVLIALAAGALGAFFSVRAVVRLSPAEAMRPPTPASFGHGLLDRLGLVRNLPRWGRSVVRNLERRPLHTTLSVLSIALSVAVLLPSLQIWASVTDLLELGFFESQRQDLAAAFTRPLPRRAVRELAALPGVLWAEPVRDVPVRLRSGHRSYETALQGFTPGTRLRQLVDGHHTVTPLPASGLVLTRTLGERLRVRPGERVTVEVLEGTRPTREVPVSGWVDEAFGMNAYLAREEVNRLLGEGDLATGALLLVDPASHDEVFLRLKRMPGVAGAQLRLAGFEVFRSQSARQQRVGTLILTGFACTIAVGVVYNAARILLTERSRELASLRVLGFTRGEISRIWLAELAAQVLVALPVGVLLGHWITQLLMLAYTTDVYRFPVVPRLDVYLLSALIVFGVSALTAVQVRRRLDRLDLVAVLKTRE